MARNKREVGEINAGSMADIAFLLLIFFLVTTTMDTDTGIMRQLPPPLDPNIEPPEVKERNVYVVLANANNQLLVENEYMDIKDLREGAIEFLTNPRNLETLPEKREVTKALCEEKINGINMQIAAAGDDQKKKGELGQSKKKWEAKLAAVELIGPYMEHPKAVISLQNDRGTHYDLYIQVQNELQSAVRQLRNELSLEKFGTEYDLLDPKEQKDKVLAIRAVIPQRISEAEPFQAN